MKVFIVGEGEWDEWHEAGTFSTREKAQAYIEMVESAEESIALDHYSRHFYKITEVEVDEASAQFPVFTAIGYVDSKDFALRVDFFSEVPESRFFVTLAPRGYEQSVYAAEGFGRTPEEAQQQLAAALEKAAAQEALIL